MSQAHVHGEAAMAAARTAKPRARRLPVAVFLLLAGVALLAGCGSATIAGDQSASGTPQAAAICPPPPQGHPSGPYIWAVTAATATPSTTGTTDTTPAASGASGASGMALVCGLGFHSNAAITLGISRFASATFTPIPNLDVKTDDKGAFSARIQAAGNSVCLNLRIRADDGQGASATTRLVTGRSGGPLPENAQPVGCPPPPRIP
jgi:hypothetical protein